MSFSLQGKFWTGCKVFVQFLLHNKCIHMKYEFAFFLPTLLIAQNYLNQDRICSKRWHNLTEFINIILSAIRLQEQFLEDNYD